MNKIDNMSLFVRVVKTGGLAAAGRQIGLSPASMTARINALEQYYNTRLLQRTTRRISLTDAGKRFYDACLRVLEEVEQAEAELQCDNAPLSGALRITAPSDFGRQHVAPLLAKFIRLNPMVTPYLHLTDNIENLIEQGYDLGIRFGNLPDSSLIVKKLTTNHRVLVASPSYLQERGTPEQPADLKQHNCLVLKRHHEPLNDWFLYNKNHQKVLIKVPITLASNDGAVIRHWALNGMGIAFKSASDVQNDIARGDLQIVLENSAIGFQSSDTTETGLQIVYPNRKHVPVQVESFIDFFKINLPQTLMVN